MNFRHFNAYAYCSKELEVLFLLDACNRLSQTMLFCNYNYLKLLFALSFTIEAINYQPTILQRTFTKINTLNLKNKLYLKNNLIILCLTSQKLKTFGFYGTLYKK